VVKGSWKNPATFLNALAAAILLFAATDESIAATFAVTTTADGNHGTCAAALCSLRDAVIAANANPGADVITLPAGIYTLTLGGSNENAAATGDLDIAGNLTINGAGAATTIVDGDGVDRVFEIMSGTVVFNDFTIRNGSTIAVDDDGGGIANHDTLTLNRCVVSGNSASDGGGILTEVELTINQSTISGNSAPDGSGGGIYNSGALTITDSTISGNTVNPDGYGGGIESLGTTVMIATSTISGNSAYDAGGLDLFDELVTILGSTIADNSAEDEGGGIFNGASALTLSKSTISGNTAGYSGGGIECCGSSTTITNSTVSGNTAPSGGGGLEVQIGEGDVATILDSTIANNTSGIAGGGILASVSGSGLTITNTIIANSGVNCSGTIADGGTNLQFPGTSCVGSIPSADPLLKPLADNGGPTLTHALYAGSPAIDAGTTGCPPTPATDQRSVTRPQGSACDIGAFELQAQTKGYRSSPRRYLR
jgi:CSLREA domain-containing protein